MQHSELPEMGSRGDSRIPWYQRLWAAVLRRAIVDWVLYKSHKDIKLRKLGIDADNWIFKERHCQLGSFLFVCEILGISEEILKKKIRGMTEEEARRLRGMEFGDEW